MPLRILCVCTGNTCRSPMLAALLGDALQRAGITATVQSAGTAAAPGDHASAEAVAAMARRGIDLSDHASCPVMSLDLSAFDRIYVVSSRHAAFVRAQGVSAERLTVVAADRGGVPDPWGGDAEVYEATARHLESEIARIVADLATLPR
ncbi:MAG TPA: low molecular weight protein arginine phosphatase [Planctomycetes bacterium]|nr:low molecular weight protein arginine phosphatase [Planctomycetota bacterium]